MSFEAVEKREQAFQWSVLPGAGFQICGRTLPKLPEGAYDCEMDMDGQIRPATFTLLSRCARAIR